MKYPIVIPLHHLGGKFGSDLELKYALRSLDRYFSDPFEVCLIGRNEPTWITSVKHLYGEGLKDCLRIASNNYPEGFFWLYDDCCLLKNTSAKTMKVTPASNGWGGNQSRWAKMLHQVKDRLSQEGIPGNNYSRSHGPYWFDKKMIDEAFTDWPNMAPKFPFESWILSKRNWPKVTGEMKQYYGAFSAPPDTKFRYLNYDDKGNTYELREWFRGTFTEKSRFEQETKKGEGLFLLNIPKSGSEIILSTFNQMIETTKPGEPSRWLNRHVFNTWSASGYRPIVACVREPISRSIQIYQTILNSTFNPKNETEICLKEMFKTLGFNRFWEEVNLKEIIKSDLILLPQYRYLEEAPLCSILRFENLDYDVARMREDLNAVRNNSFSRKVNTTPQPFKASKKAEEKIKQLYRRDFEMFYPGCL